MKNKSGSDKTEQPISDKQQPESEDEWIIHALNIHGLFLERWCKQVVEDAPAWRCAATYEPVEFPPGGGKESNLDLRVVHDFNEAIDGYSRLKNNPEFIKWIFFPKTKTNGGGRGPKTDITAVRQIQIENTPSRLRPFFRMALKQILSGLIIADEAREVRGDYVSYKDKGGSSNKTKTANNAITEASRQIALATQAIYRKAAEEIDISDSLQQKFPWAHQIFLPIIVTTAKLFSCQFDPKDVGSMSGEILFDKANLEEQKVLLFEYPLPVHLQLLPTVAGAPISHDERLYSRMDIMIVQSDYFPKLLQELAYKAHFLFVQ